MAEIFKFFNSAPGDERWHYASDFADYFGSVLSSGLISNGDSPVGLQATVNSGTMTTSVNVGRALIKGYSYENTTPLTLTHSIPEQTLDRIDRIVLRLDLKNASRFIKVFVKEGVSALEPVAPDLQRDQYIYELSLAQIRIRKNTSSLVVSDIKDERADENLCGIVQSLITVPTSVFQQQFDTWFASIADGTEQSVADWQNAQQQAFTVWFESIKGQLEGDIGAKLASEITEHKADNISHDTYVSCSSASATAEKVVSVTGFNLVEGARITVKFANANTATTPTLKVNTELSKPLVKADGTAFKNIKAGIYSFVYSGTSFTVQGEGGEYGTATASDVLAGKTFGTDEGLIVGTATISSLGGKKWASGTTRTERFTNNYFWYSDSESVYCDFWLNIVNLTFKPSTIVIQNASTGFTHMIYSSSATYQNKPIITFPTLTTCRFAINKGHTEIRDNGFKLPFLDGYYEDLNWYAYE